jgi:hypothetical protein
MVYPRVVLLFFLSPRYDDEENFFSQTWHNDFWDVGLIRIAGFGQ